MSTAIPADVRERVIQAAQELYEQSGRETMPTVDAVRRLARVDMNSASAVMREWRRSQTAQASPVAVAVPEAVTQAHSAALASLWQTAQEMATESLRGAQAAWETERAEADHDRQELADAYERQATELEEVRAAAARSAELHQEQQDARAQELATLRTELATATTRAERAEARASEIEKRAADLRSELDHAHHEQERRRTELATAAARAERAEAATQAAEQRAAELAAELAQARANATAADQSHKEQKQAAAEEALRQAERYTRAKTQRDDLAEQLAEARENAARLGGQLEAVQTQNAALLARLDAREKKGAVKPAE